MYTIKQNIPSDLPKEVYRAGIGNYEGVCAHATAVYEDSDEGESNYFKRDWKKISAFVHYFVDYDSITQTADIKYKAWGAGKYGNQRYVHVELCQTKDKNKFLESYKRYTWLMAKILFDKKLDVIYGKTFVTHEWVTKNLGGTSHTDPVDYLQFHGVSIEQLINDVKNEYSNMGKQVVQEVKPMTEKSWEQITGEKAIDELFKKGKLKNPDNWKAKDLVNENTSLWLFFEMINRLNK
ncbi:MAG: peptidoglycan recognition family protein [Tissierellia bacterium]|nr:peptidoglycan recognition family protein [Tissierellia bacterium]